MRLTVTFQALDFPVELPLSYNYAVQSFIYHHISSNLADFLHNKGYRYEKRVYRLFTFSRLTGKYKIEEKDGKIVFTEPFKLQISSPVSDFLQEFAETLARSQDVIIKGNHLIVSSIEVHFSPPPTSSALIRMLSPVTIYSTLLTPNGKKKVYYYSPFEPEFSQLIQKNLIKKYVSFYNKTPTSDDFKIFPVKVNKGSEKIIRYTPKKGPETIVKGWMGVYRIQGNPELIALAYDAGLGSKSPQGFGMFDILN
ncbi:CRISPR-associated endoribonuclease Cas6 [Candidatus Aerophobetes bacterium]|uniref:CRISPR-associated endoribonuclease n=1 Tax=Aerophobetes bacterium TaxID=2030807 RepID=A0A7V0MZ13_UNCAE|nr:CRISPR-associated endoribonuclease Cas6 [Candidatus Aerophobetes bacterium]HDN84148.1 CRISPR-associated endoribonuclease Cas6 [Candidatus Aerophobetes bacterium]